MTFDHAWQAFADDDSHQHAPPALEGRVRDAIATPNPPESRPRFNRTGAIAVAASIGLAAVWAGRHTASPRVTRALDSRAPTAALTTYAATVSREIIRVGAPPAVPRVAVRGPQTLGRPILRLAVDEVAPSETLQLVRMRLPREALLALGVTFAMPDTSGLVDIDVLIGEDGLPRDIRRIRIEP